MRVVVRRKYLIVVFCLAATLTALALTYVVTERYQSYTTLLTPPGSRWDLVLNRGQ